jgi:hypothetical protein
MAGDGYDNDIGQNTVRLTKYEVLLIHWVVNEQLKYNKEHGLNYEGRGHRDVMERYIMGIGGEYSTAIGLNLAWRPRIGDYDAADAGGCIEVKTRSDWEQRLEIKPKNPSTRPYVLVVARANHVYHLRGWHWGSYIKTWPLVGGIHSDRRHRMPNDRLMHMNDLRDWIYARPSSPDVIGNREPCIVSSEPVFDEMDAVPEIREGQVDRESADRPDVLGESSAAASPGESGTGSGAGGES